jgi:hypothetical protein
VMERLDVDPRALARLRHGDAYAEARVRCLHCGTSDLCLRWLERSAGSAPLPTFCPNLPVLDACRRPVGQEPSVAGGRLPGGESPATEKESRQRQQ